MKKKKKRRKKKCVTEIRRLVGGEGGEGGQVLLPLVSASDLHPDHGGQR